MSVNVCGLLGVMFLEHLSSGKLPKCFIDCIAKAPVSTEMQSSWLDCSKALKGHGNSAAQEKAGRQEVVVPPK